MIRLLVFDLDGTLVNTMGDYGDKAAALMHSAFGTGIVQARADYFRTSGLPFCQQLKILYPENPATDDVAEAFEDWKDIYLQSITLPAAVETLFNDWRASGLYIAISSNNGEYYVERMARTWPVDIALGYRERDGFAKGEAHFATLQNALSLQSDEILFTGDSPNDARIALRCGIEFRALLTPEFTAADFKAIAPDVKILHALSDLQPNS
jgi:phosphoglycolate phosphatase-like HAD superfamily hydrolase